MNTRRLAWFLIFFDFDRRVGEPLVIGGERRGRQYASVKVAGPWFRRRRPLSRPDGAISSAEAPRLRRWIWHPVAEFAGRPPNETLGVVLRAPQGFGKRQTKEGQRTKYATSKSFHRSITFPLKKKRQLVVLVLLGENGRVFNNWDFYLCSCWHFTRKRWSIFLWFHKMKIILFDVYLIMFNKNKSGEILSYFDQSIRWFSFLFFLYTILIPTFFGVIVLILKHLLIASESFDLFYNPTDSLEDVSASSSCMRLFFSFVLEHLLSLAGCVFFSWR